MTTHKRVLITGDSIQTYTYTADGTVGDAKSLTASLIPLLTNASVCNFSGAGQRMSSGGIPGFGLCAQKAAIQYLMGSLKADIVVITVGVNDWGAPEVSAFELIADYQEMIRYFRSLGMEVIVVPPLWNHEQEMAKPHADGGSYTLAQFRHYIAQSGYIGGAHVFDATQIGLLPEHFADGLHMNGEGHKLFAAALVSQAQAWGLLP